MYFAGWTSGTFLHELPAGGLDGVIGKLRDDGALMWFKQFGSASDDEAVALSVAGNGLYVAGSTTGELPDGTQLGESDGFLRKYLPNGTEVWTRQFGTTDYDAVYGTAVGPQGRGRRGDDARGVRGPDERRRPRRLPREDRVLLTRLPRRGLARTAIWWKLAA